MLEIMCDIDKIIKIGVLNFSDRELASFSFYKNMSGFMRS